MKHGEKVCISVKALFEEYGENLEDVEIRHTTEDDEEYFDIYDPFFGVLCSDGEECRISSIDGEKVLLEGYHDANVVSFFWLTVPEFKTAVFE